MNTDPLERDNAILLGVLLEVPGLLTGDELARASGLARWSRSSVGRSSTCWACESR